MAAFDSGATAHSVCFRWFERHKRLLVKEERQKISAFPASALFRFGDGRLGEARHAAHISVGIAGNKGKFTAFATCAEIPA